MQERVSCQCPQGSVHGIHLAGLFHESSEALSLGNSGLQSEIGRKDKEEREQTDIFVLLLFVKPLFCVDKGASLQKT